MARREDCSWRAIDYADVIPGVGAGLIPFLAARLE